MRSHPSTRTLPGARRPRAAERGATAVFMAIVMPLLLLVTGVVVDGGRLILERRKAQAIADSAALGGALYVNEDMFATSWDNGGRQKLELKLDSGIGRAYELVGQYHQDPNFQSVQLSNLTVDAQGLKATTVATSYVPYFFLPIIDLFGGSVSARAQAQMVYGISQAGQ